jgi:prepilin-type processing-associated H-X9-DG protein/prepilin-type N-terminal cleavage/methylation domain-containing protein
MKYTKGSSSTFKRSTGTRAAKGFTLIEVTVVVVIIGLLVAILIPAVQFAREASRRTHCLANLRQLGLGVNQYLTASGVLPGGNTNRGYSFYVMILPYIEQKPLYDSFNFSVPGYLPSPAPNDTASGVSLALLLCPSDPIALGRAGYTSYAGNQGVGFCKNSDYGVCDNGAFVWPGSSSISTQAVTDGTSSTVMIAEWLVGSGMSKDPRRAVYSLAGRFAEPDQFETFARQCYNADARTAAPYPAEKGLGWGRGTAPLTLYNHTEPINSRSCVNDSGVLMQQSAWTAGSMHPGGANVLYVDGHVRFLNASIAAEVWRALGTRNGAEVISSDSY